MTGFSDTKITAYKTIAIRKMLSIYKNIQCVICVYVCVYVSNEMKGKVYISIENHSYLFYTIRIQYVSQSYNCVYKTSKHFYIAHRHTVGTHMVKSLMRTLNENML